MIHIIINEILKVLQLFHTLEFLSKTRSKITTWYPILIDNLVRSALICSHMLHYYENLTNHQTKLQISNLFSWVKVSVCTSYNLEFDCWLVFLLGFVFCSCVGRSVGFDSLEDFGCVHRLRVWFEIRACSERVRSGFELVISRWILVFMFEIGVCVLVPTRFVLIHPRGIYWTIIPCIIMHHI